MIVAKKSIPRRTVLRGLGAAVALPFLDSMVPAFAAIRNSAANPVRRFGVVYVPNGMAMKHFTPEAEGVGFNGRAGLRDMLMDRPDDFVGTVAEKLLMYALGRDTEYYDTPVVRKIVRDSAGNGYRWSSIILGIVKSRPFYMRRSDS